MSNVYVIGVFDLFHRGHVELLKRSKALGEKLIVAVNGDKMVSQYKRRPYMTEQDRLEIIKSCRYVDEAFIIQGFDNKQVLIDYKIDKIVHGDDWKRESYLEQIRVDRSFMEKHNIELVLLPYTKGISTGELINEIKGK
ncbi:MAG: adenylyltransferase/cytidyltransferase family protein [Lentisphaerales bacterium]|nr:adenylyltransferase/cytidyltransferase family protein [Lentisphaerales bacterium]